MDNYSFANYLAPASDAELRNFGGLCTEYLDRLDLTDLGQSAGKALEDSARIVWSQVQAERLQQQAEPQAQRRARFGELRYDKPVTWEMSGQLLYRNGCTEADFHDGDRQAVLTAIATGRIGVRESRIALHTALHAHLDSGFHGVTSTYVLDHDGRIATMVYAVSHSRSGNKYRWGGGKYQDGAQHIRWVSDDPAFTESQRLLTDREKIATETFDQVPAADHTPDRMTQRQEPAPPLRTTAITGRKHIFFQRRHRPRRRARPSRNPNDPPRPISNSATPATYSSG